MRKLAFAFFIVVATALAWWPSIDAQGSDSVEAAFKRALVTWALARGLNGVVSVAQGTEVAIQPAGVGVNFAPGEILDPVNDLIERFSWIMMLAASSLGVQKVLLSMSSWHGLVLALSLAAGCALVAQWVFKRPQVAFVASRIFLFLLLLRFMMPGIALANQWVYDTFLDADYQSASEELATAQEQISELNQVSRDERAGDENEEGSALSRAREIVRRIGDSVSIEKRMDDYQVAAERISEGTIRLLVVFLMQTVVFPLVFLFVVFGLIKRVVRLS